MSDLYVVVADNDQPIPMPNGKQFIDEHGPIVFERYTRDCSLEGAKEHIRKLNGRYGKCRIAKLTFIEGEIE